MSAITLKSNFTTGITPVKNIFIDHYMVQANGEYVKIYLYLLRCMNGPQLSSSLSINQFADTFDCTEKDILRALKYWENAGLLTMEFSGEQLSSILLTEPESTVAGQSVSAATTLEQTPSSPDKIPKTVQTGGKYRDQAVIIHCTEIYGENTECDRDEYDPVFL